MSTTPSGNHESLKSKISKRKKARSNSQLSCKIECYIKTNSACFSDRSAFFTDDQVASGRSQCYCGAEIDSASIGAHIVAEHRREQSRWYSAPPQREARKAPLTSKRPDPSGPVSLPVGWCSPAMVAGSVINGTAIVGVRARSVVSRPVVIAGPVVVWGSRGGDGSKGQGAGCQPESDTGSAPTSVPATTPMGFCGCHRCRGNSTDRYSGEGKFSHVSPPIFNPKNQCEIVLPVPRRQSSLLVPR